MRSTVFLQERQQIRFVIHTVDLVQDQKHRRPGFLDKVKSLAVGIREAHRGIGHE